MIDVIASSPSRHWPTTSMSGSFDSRFVSRSRASGSSSTTSVLIFFMSLFPWKCRRHDGCSGAGSRRADRPHRPGGPYGTGRSPIEVHARRLLVLESGGRSRPPGNGNDDGDALFEAMKFESEICAVLMLQARAGGRDADAFLQRRERRLRQPEPGVANFNPEFVVVTPRANVDVAGARLLRDAVLDGVLDERLQEQRRHQGVERVRLDVEPDHQTVDEARLFDFQVLGQEIELRLQLDFLAAEVLERQAEE